MVQSSKVFAQSKNFVQKFGKNSVKIPEVDNLLQQLFTRACWTGVVITFEAHIYQLKSVELLE